MSAFMPLALDHPWTIGLDGGTTESALVVLQFGKPVLSGTWPNEQVRDVLLGRCPAGATLAYEMIASYGMTVGAETFETVFWTGRFVELWDGHGYPVERVFRREVKAWMCQAASNAKVKDAQVRQAIIDRFGGKERAVGKKKTPGPLYGLAGDEWSALGVALTSIDRRAAGAST